MEFIYGIFGMIVLAITFIVLNHCSKEEEVEYKVDPATLDPATQEFNALFEKFRREKGLSILQVDALASRLCWEHNLYMWEVGVTHDGIGEEKGILEDFGAKNIKDIVNGKFSTIQTCFSGFENSADHNNVMSLTNVDTCGIDISLNPDNNKWYATIIVFKR